MAIIKNTAGQGLYVYAHDVAADAAKTGDAANITATLSKDGAAGAATNDTNPTEIGGGVYWFDLTQAESNAGALALVPVSGTADVQIDPVLVLTQEVAIDSRASQTSVDDLPTNSELATALAAADDAVLAAVGALNNFDPATDIVARVTLVDTTTTNTDMVAEAPSAADNATAAAAAILVTPANKLATGADGVASANLTSYLGKTPPDLDGLDGLDGSTLALEATAQAILEDTGTTLPALLAGGGSTAYSNTITDTGSNPLDGVEVWITSDSGGASTVASTTTDTLGAFTVYLDPGTYYLWLAKGGYNFGNPTTITVT